MMKSPDDNSAPDPFLASLPLIGALTGIFFLNFLSRFIFSPLLVLLEKDLNISHAEAGAFFFYITLGYFAGLAASGFVSSRVSHGSTIVISCLASGVALAVTAFGRNIPAVQIGLIILGAGTGLYLPSGISTLTSALSPRHWGKAFSIHEIAPTFAFVAGPLIAQALTVHYSWRFVLLTISLFIFFAGIAAWRWIPRTSDRGEAPNPKNIAKIASMPTFWGMVAVFSLGIGMNVGLYAMLSLFLQTERALPPDTANFLLSLSRLAALGSPFLGGWASDRFGPKPALFVIMIASGTATLFLGLSGGYWTIPFLFLQPILAVCFFPPAFAVLMHIVEPNLRNIIVSLVIPPAMLLGGGAVPTLIGYFGDRGHFDWGISMIGILVLSGVFLVCRIQMRSGAD
jgi:NNP family nitrate/nitrite transporter-like MFS transporter